MAAHLAMRGARRAALAGTLIILSALQSSAATAKPSTVAVMPFRDLAADSKFIGEAIRETVMSDLRQLGGLRVVERASLDRVLAEQKLAQKDLEVGDAVRVGKVLGAQLMVVGAYQKLAPQVRLTARFIKVETSEVIGTAKVDGSQREFLRLQDRVTSALLRSAGLPVQAKQVLDDSAQRPDLQSWKTLDLYGQAVLATDDSERRNLLQLAVAEDKNFSYAVKDLAGLESRLARYQAEQDAATERALKELRQQLAVATERPQIEQLTVMLLTKLYQTHRFHAQAKEARSFLEGLGPGAALTPTVDQIAVMLVTADQLLRDDEGLLRDGELYLRRAPGSSMFSVIKQLMEGAIARKRQVDEGRDKAVKDVAGINTEARWDLYLIGQLYARNQQFAEAQRLYRACLQVGNRPPVEVLLALCQVDFQAGDWTSLRADLSALERADAAKAHTFRVSWAAAIPVDG
jgi:TolB-like protein